MSLWCTVFKIDKLKRELRTIERIQITRVLYACIQHAFASNQAECKRCLRKKAFAILKGAFADLQRAASGKQTLREFAEWAQELNRIAAEEDSEEMAIPGFEYIRIALWEAFEFLRDQKPAHVLNALYAAYQSVASVADEEFMLTEQRGLVGIEIAEAEAASPKCREEVDYQLECLKRAKGGELT